MIQQNIPSSVKNSSSPSSSIWAANLPNLAKNYLWQATFTTPNLNQTQLDNLKLRCKKIKHDTPNRKFSLTFDEFEDFDVAKSFDILKNLNSKIDITLEYFDGQFKKVLYTQSYTNCEIECVHGIDLDQCAAEKIEIKVDFKY